MTNAKKYKNDVYVVTLFGKESPVVFGATSWFTGKKEPSYHQTRAMQGCDKRGLDGVADIMFGFEDDENKIEFWGGVNFNTPQNPRDFLKKEMLAQYEKKAARNKNTS